MQNTAPPSKEEILARMGGDAKPSMISMMMGTGIPKPAAQSIPPPP